MENNKNKKFNQLEQSIKLRRCSIPQHVSVTKNPDDETDEQTIERQERFLILPVPIKEKISSYETGEKIQAIAKQFNLDLISMAVVARTVRNYYFNEIKLEDFPGILSKEMNVDSKIAQEISDKVIREIIQDKTAEKEYARRFSQIKIKEAIQKYKELNEQLITSFHIRLNNFPEPVRPSIKNWISDYTFKTGFDSHSSMDRGTYLFQSENTKMLNAIDRRKLGYILKAYDENSEVEVDETAKQIIFPKNEPTWREGIGPSPAPQEKEEPKDIFERGREIEQRSERVATPKFSPVNPSASASTESIRFSSPQKLPFENQSPKPQKETIPPPLGPIKISPRERRGKLDEDFKNVINLRD